MDNVNFTHLAQDKNLISINNKLGVLAPFFWSVYAVQAGQGVDAKTAGQKTLEIVRDYLSPDAITGLTGTLGVQKVA